MERAPFDRTFVSRRQSAMDGTSRRAPMHPDIAYDLAKLKIAEDLRTAERERLVRQAGRRRDSGAIDAVAFRDRVARLFGITPNRTNRSRPAGAQP